MWAWLLTSFVFCLANSNGLCENPETVVHDNENAVEAKWLTFLPLEHAFPQGTYISCAWNLSEAKIHELFTAIRIHSNRSANAIRISTANFVDAVPESAPFLQNQPLSGHWCIPLSIDKRAAPPWVEQVLLLRNSPSPANSSVACITQLPLSVWLEFSATENPVQVPGAPGCRKRFMAVYMRFCKLHEALHTFSTPTIT